MTAPRTVKRLGREAGFDLVRITGAEPLEIERERYLAWIKAGRQGEMRWITEGWAERCADPRSVLPDARSVICVGLSYWRGPRPADTPATGRIARYAWGDDYHRVMGERLRALATALQGELGGECRAHVDTGPLAEKALAVRAGLGWYGKNTNILTESLGSFVLLGEIVTTLDLQPDPPLQQDCGACRLCQVACPTGALGADYIIDSRRCISYLTIEHRGPIPRVLRPAIGNWVFGCDICQDVCPPAMRPHLTGAGDRRNWAAAVRRYAAVPRALDSLAPAGVGQAPDGPHPLFVGPVRPGVDLLWLLQISHEEYLGAFRGSAIRRAKAWMLRRNAAVALGNVGDSSAAQPLAAAMRGDEHPVVRGHAAWALARLAARHDLDAAEEWLRGALAAETDESVREELRLALEETHDHP